MSRVIIYICLLLYFVNCKKNSISNVNNVDADSNIIMDQYGRQLILHGLNTSSSAKGEPLRNPWILDSDVEKEATDFGFNFVRYLIFWDAIEPEKNVFDETYLDRIEERIEWYTSRGMYVMLDMHQDLYSLKYGGDGAPNWACREDGSPTIDLGPDSPWWLKNIDPAIIKSWTNFWEYTNHRDLQEHYSLAWQFVMKRFKDNPYVIGYDLMNEPWGGDLIKVFIDYEFESLQLVSFYNRIIPELRAIEPNKYFFFEPTPAPVTFGVASRLPFVKDTRSTSRLVYAPHCYPYDTHEGVGYTSAAQNQLKRWELERRKDVTVTHKNIPLLVGEFGLSPTNIGFDNYMTDFLAMTDRNNWHWAYWSNDLGGWSPLNGDRTEAPVLNHLIRVYPAAVSGRIDSFSYNPITKEFKLSYTNISTISQPTEIIIPQRIYPNGYNLEITGTANYISIFDSNSQKLKINVSDNNTVNVLITAN